MMRATASILSMTILLLGCRMLNGLVGHSCRIPFLQPRGIRCGTSMHGQLMDGRLKRGEVTIHDLNRLFGPSDNEMDSIQTSTSSGFVGVVVSLESTLVDTLDIYRESYTMLAKAIQVSQPELATLRDLIGSPFRDIVSGVGWGGALSADLILMAEQRLYDIMARVIDHPDTEVHASAGARELVDSVIAGGDEVCVLTQLPRHLAVPLLTKSGLSPLFEQRVSSHRLVCLIDEETSAGGDGDGVSSHSSVAPQPGKSKSTSGSASQSGERYMGRQLYRCCGAMEKPPALSLLVDGNRRNLLAAKHHGLSCIAVKGERMTSCCVHAAYISPRMI